MYKVITVFRKSNFNKLKLNLKVLRVTPCVRLFSSNPKFFATTNMFKYPLKLSSSVLWLIKNHLQEIITLQIENFPFQKPRSLYLDSNELSGFKSLLIFECATND